MKREKIEEQLRNAQRGARSRTLDMDDVVGLLEDVRRAQTFLRRRKLGRLAEELEGCVDGGAVNNSYDYRADSTHARVVGGALTIRRTWARKVAYGDNGVSWVRLPLTQAGVRDLVGAEGLARLKRTGWCRSTDDIDQLARDAEAKLRAKKARRAARAEEDFLR